jgi:hypothetical protein
MVAEILRRASPATQKNKRSQEPEFSSQNNIKNKKGNKREAFELFLFSPETQSCDL